MDKLQRMVELIPDRSARSLKPGYRGNRGWMVLLKQSVGHESDLERDLLLLLQFDPTLVAIREQPFTVGCTGANGRETKYTADFITVHGGEQPRGFLIEVKYVSELREKWRTLVPRLRAGRAFAEAKGLTFLLLTERQIRARPLGALWFLSRFLDLPRNESTEEHLVHRLAGIGPSTPPRLLAAAFELKSNQQQALPYVWKLIANGRITADLDQGEINMATPIWIARDSSWRTYDPYSRSHMLRTDKGL